MLDRSEVGGENGSEAGVPRPGIQAQRPAPAPHASHARHDRSMAREFDLWLGRTRRIFLLLLLSARRVSRLEYMGMYFMHVFCTRLMEY